jgi:putative endonuclease
MTKAYCVYILASARNGTLYIGATSDLVKRVYEHKTGAADGFTRKYAVHCLVWFEQHESALGMVTRERQLKEWKRAWKVELIEAANPTWRDLYGEILGAGAVGNG